MQSFRLLRNNAALNRHQVRIPSEGERSIRLMANTDSDGSRTPVPTEPEH
jgi:hypothetical protein